MLRVALPNKGQLSEPAKQMLAEAGYLRSRNPRDLVITDAANGVEFFLLRPRDIATYVGAGTLDLGITGRDMLADSAADADEILPLGFAPSTFRLAAPVGTCSVARRTWTARGSRRPTPRSCGRTWRRIGRDEPRIVRLDGAVENAVRLGVADAVADVVDTGGTLRSAGLQTIGEPILHSEALLIRAQERPDAPEVDVFVRRLQGVLTARSYVLVDYDIPMDRVEEACDLTPGLESPTVSPLHEQGWAAVRAVVPKAEVHRIMDRLADIGGRGDPGHRDLRLQVVTTMATTAARPRAPVPPARSVHASPAAKKAAGPQTNHRRAGPPAKQAAVAHPPPSAKPLPPAPAATAGGRRSRWPRMRPPRSGTIRRPTERIVQRQWPSAPLRRGLGVALLGLRRCGPVHVRAMPRSCRARGAELPAQPAIDVALGALDVGAGGRANGCRPTLADHVNPLLLRAWAPAAGVRERGRAERGLRALGALTEPLAERGRRLRADSEYEAAAAVAAVLPETIQLVMEQLDLTGLWRSPTSTSQGAGGHRGTGRPHRVRDRQHRPRAG